MTQSQSSKVLKGPLILLGFMSIVSFLGPFGLKWVLMGGRQTGWPPDRAVEWVALVGVVGAAVVLLTAILVLNLRNLKVMNAELDASKARARQTP